MYISTPVKIAVTFGLGLAIGTKAGWKFAQYRLNEKYNAQMEEEIERTKKFYAHLNKEGFETPQAAADALGVTGDDAVINAAEALRSYKGHPVVQVDADHVIITKEGAVVDLEDPSENKAYEAEVDATVAEMTELVNQNIFQVEGENVDVSGRTPEIPYQITQIEFMANDDDYEQVSITWYAGDNQLTDEHDQIIPDHRIVGKHNLERFGTGRDPNIVLVRNEKLRMDYEILRHDGKYEHVVAGFAHSDESYERRPRRRSADE